MTADGRALAATLIAEYVIAQNSARGIRMDGDRRALIALEAEQVAHHLDESGALAS